MQYRPIDIPSTYAATDESDYRNGSRGDRGAGSVERAGQRFELLVSSYAR